MSSKKGLKAGKMGKQQDRNQESKAQLQMVAFEKRQQLYQGGGEFQGLTGCYLDCLEMDFGPAVHFWSDRKLLQTFAALTASNLQTVGRLPQ